MTNRISKKEAAMKYGKSRKFGIDQLLIALSCVFLAIFVIYPMIMILYNALWNGSSIDFSMFIEVIFQKENVQALKNTVVIAFFVTLFSTIIGVFFAWLLARSDIPAKGVMRWLFTIPFMIPPFLGAMAWDMMLSARGGYINRWLMTTFSLKQAPFNVNSVAGIILVETVFSWPGLGGLFYQALSVPDLPLVQGLFFVFAAAVIVMNTLADLIYPLLDPRVGR